MLVITGACGFIGSAMVRFLNERGRSDLLLVDHHKLYPRNLKNIACVNFYDIEDVSILKNKITGVFHFGAISDTLEKNRSRIQRYNIDSTFEWSNWCRDNGVPMLFASTAAVYGNGNGVLNQYAESKAKCEEMVKDHAMCFRLFNVYGDGESHKGRMASVIYKWYNELKTKGEIEIFENSSSYKRDFIHVSDVCRCFFNALADFVPGVYDLGTGVQNSFEDVANAILSTESGRKVYIPMPDDLQRQYQINTLADMSASIRWLKSPIQLCEGISQYLGVLNDKK
jgi:ADP-L-glycero-D-manno-heptose 6-epimerase